jgi:transcription termination factor Rho
MNIPQPRFLLRNPKDKRPTLISCHIRFNNDRIIFSTGEKIIILCPPEAGKTMLAKGISTILI